MRISYGVVGHHSRATAAKRLAEQLGAYLAMDDGGRGSLVNHDAAWCGALRDDADWVVVVEDDALPVPDFHRHVKDALAAIPGEGAVSFYTGSLRPRAMAFTRALAEAEEDGAAWLSARAAYWGPALALRVQHVKPMLRRVANLDMPYDARLSVYLRRAQLPCFYTVPSLVDHEDGPSLLGNDRRGGRRARSVGVPFKWNTAAVRVA